MNFCYEYYISTENTFEMLIFDVYTTFGLILLLMLLFFFSPERLASIIHKTANSTGNIDSRKILIELDNKRKL